MRGGGGERGSTDVAGGGQVPFGARRSCALVASEAPPPVPRGPASRRHWPSPPCCSCRRRRPPLAGALAGRYPQRTPSPPPPPPTDPRPAPAQTPSPRRPPRTPPPSQSRRTTRAGTLPPWHPRPAAHPVPSCHPPPPVAPPPHALAPHRYQRTGWGGGERGEQTALSPPPHHDAPRHTLLGGRFHRFHLPLPCTGARREERLRPVARRAAVAVEGEQGRRGWSRDPAGALASSLLNRHFLSTYVTFV